MSDRDDLYQNLRKNRNAAKYDEPTTPVQVRVPLSVKEYWQEQAARENMNLTQWLIKMLPVKKEGTEDA